MVTGGAGFIGSHLVERLLDFFGLDSHRLSVVIPEAPMNLKWSDGQIRSTRLINWITGFPHSIHHESIGIFKRWVRKTLQTFYLVFERLATRLLGRAILPLDFDVCDRMIDEAYHEQNRKLRAELGIPVNQYEYPGFCGNLEETQR